MKIIPLLLLTLSLCASCVSNPDAEAHRLALWNFHYEKDINNEYRVYDSISIPFRGDCEDFALTLQKQIGGNVWFVAREGKENHAALVKNGFVYDSLSAHPIDMNEYQGEFIYIIRAGHEL
ncbi:MAG: hypothetical protein GY881_15805 [Gammaproteobacteria bacterium]|nr:hypothetical protein [Gammaproteobacteria bacterium]